MGAVRGAAMQAGVTRLLRSSNRARTAREVTAWADGVAPTAPSAEAVEVVPHQLRFGAFPHTQRGLVQRRWREKRHSNRLRVTDAAIVIVVVTAAAFAQVLLQDEPADVWEVLRPPLLVVPCWLTALSLVNSRSTSVLGSGSTEYRRVVHATGLAFGMIAIVFIIFQWSGMRMQLMAGLPLGVTSLLAGRWLWRGWLVKQRRRGHYTSHALVVGSKRDVEYVIQRLDEAGSLGYEVVGVAIDEPNARELHINGRRYHVVASLSSVAAVAQAVQADAIVVASQPESDADYIKRLAWQLEGTAAELILSSRLADVAGPRISLRPVDGMPLIHVRIPEFEGDRLVAKRALDIVVASAALVVITLLLPVLAVLIKLDSPGPVFFRQRRVGLNGRDFDMIKFRSMRRDAETDLAALSHKNEAAGPLFKMRNDPRVTRLGRFLRKYSIDELPQFWNVLRGDMSVVGPRPPLRSEVVQYDDHVFRRFYIKPGITGLWQISGRSNLSWEDSVRLDLRYVENWSIILDIIIIWRTLRVAFSPNGAY